MEEWKDVLGYEGLYQVSSYGRVRNRHGKEMSQFYDKDGYKVVVLNHNYKRKYRKVHRLVGIAFIDNPNNYPSINHKDENKNNNNVENLEWCTISYNNNYGERNKAISDKQKGKPRYYAKGENNYFWGKHFTAGKSPSARSVAKLDQEGNILKIYDCIVSAANDVKCNRSFITMVCQGKRKTAKGYKWKYTDDLKKLD